jgi:hypothetical protein
VTSGPPGGAPLAGTFERLRRFDDLCRAEIGVPSDETEHDRGWLPLGTITAHGLDELFAAAQRGGPRRPDYLGATVAAALVDVLVSTALPALLLERRLPEVAPANLTVRLHDDELWFHRVALVEPRCWALPDDPEAGDATVRTVANLDQLHVAFADVVVAAARGWFDAVRARAPFGRRGMWGQLADDVSATALWTARAAGLDQHETWDEGQAVIDVIAAAVPDLRVRPRRFPVRWSGGESLWHVKGTCCLWYTTAEDPDPCGDGYCTTCPLRPDDVRHERLAAWLETQTADAG